MDRLSPVHDASPATTSAGGGSVAPRGRKGRSAARGSPDPVLADRAKEPAAKDLAKERFGSALPLRSALPRKQPTTLQPLQRASPTAVPRDKDATDAAQGGEALPSKRPKPGKASRGKIARPRPAAPTAARVL